MKKLYDPMPDLDRSECTPDLFSDPVKLLHCYMVKICDCSTIDEFVRLKGIIDKGIVSRWSSWKMGKSIPSKTTIEKIMAGDPEWAGRALSVFDQLKEDLKHSRETESIPVKGAAEHFGHDWVVGHCHMQPEAPACQFFEAKGAADADAA